MKKLILISFLVAVAMTTYAQQSNFPKLSGPYLGQKPPGTTPEIFARGIVSLNETTESRCLVWNDGRKILLGRNNAGYLETELKNGRWTPFTSTNIFRNHDHLQ